MQKGSAVEGQSCTVTSGPNKGKKGKYTVDENGNIWCEGDWGGTQCDGGKCKDGAAQIGIFEFVKGGQVVYEVDGLVEADGGDIFHVRATIDAASGASREIAAVPITATPLSDLRGSKSKVERMVAKAVDSHVR